MEKSVKTWRNRVHPWVFILLTLASCTTVGPDYHRPPVKIPSAFKELSWKTASPNDHVIRGKWWEIFQDSELNALEEKVNISNQNIASSVAAFLQARTLIKSARSQYLPTINLNPNLSAIKGQGVTSGYSASSAGVFGQYSIPFTASWMIDLWGRIRNTVDQNTANAQASFADLENMRLSQQSELAMTYFQLRAQDALIDLYQNTLERFRQSLKLTRAQYETGINSDEAVAQAETQLKVTEAQATQLGITRAQYEHAIALLVGEPASTFSIKKSKWKIAPPSIPTALPSQLLERRPDIAAAERRMAAANSQIGVATAAYYPNLVLNGYGGAGKNSVNGFFSIPSYFWSLGATLAETIFNGGLREATLEQTKAAYQQAVANYRQTVLTAFRQVEDTLVQLRLLTQQLKQQQSAIQSSKRYSKIALNRYQLGIDPYLNVLNSQITLLSTQQNEITLQMLRMTGSIQLIQALGGGWESMKIPDQQGILANPMKTPPNQE